MASSLVVMRVFRKMGNYFFKAALAQANALRIKLENHFGHALYFRLRSGKRFIGPTEQAHIRQAMNELRVNPLPDFDAYVEAYNWQLIQKRGH